MVAPAALGADRIRARHALEGDRLDRHGDLRHPAQQERLEKRQTASSR